MKETGSGYSRNLPTEAIFRSATRLNAAGSEKDTRHVVIDISASGLSYAPGDSFGLYASNDPQLVDAVLAAMRAPADFPVGDKTLRQALIEDYALGAAPDALFELISYVARGAKRKKAKLLSKGEDPDGDAATFDVLAALEAFGPIHPDPEAFLECLEPLQPRLYSISSSPLTTPGEVHLTVDAVRYDIDGRTRLGVASTFLADRLSAGTGLKVYLQKAHGFGLPEDPGKPIIMVGPGTGIAPFRSFLWQRHAMKAPGKSWLFFGHQREATDFFYREELENLTASGTLTRLSTAWSRDGAAQGLRAGSHARSRRRAVGVAAGGRAFLHLRRRQAHGQGRRDGAGRYRHGAWRQERGRRQGVPRRPEGGRPLSGGRLLMAGDAAPFSLSPSTGRRSGVRGRTVLRSEAAPHP